MGNAATLRSQWSVPSEEWEDLSPREYTLARFKDDDEPDNDSILERNTFVDDFVSRLRRKYHFRDDIAVERFLRENLFLVKSLYETAGKIREYFGGSGVRAALEIIVDPDAPNESQLFIIIQTKFRAQISRTILRDLDRDWWPQVPLEARRKMELAVE